MSEHLFVNNHLIKIDSGIWMPESDVKSLQNFSYSDGDLEEQYLYDVMNTTEDLSCQSLELASRARDWSSLYHLSPKRSNLLKGLNITKAQRVLEIGAGCGAITRYLAEQGCIVHAVEGSRRRAEIVRKRTKNMDNVEVICANATSLVWPKQRYDIVLFVGVLEYSGRFIDQKNLTHKQAILFLLDKASQSISPHGYVYIAIENRVGLKYQFGADEDHFGKPYIGLQGYPSDDFASSNNEVQTYSKSEWISIFSELGEILDLSLYHRFYYPFPDYKLPIMCIFDDNYAPELESYFNKINSYDPTSRWFMPVDEISCWKQAFREGYLGNVSNSFGILLSHNSKNIVKPISLKACKFLEDGIHPNYQEFNYFRGDNDITHTSFSSLSITEQATLNIITLEQNWTQRLSNDANLDKFVVLVSQCYAAMQEQNFDPNTWFMTHNIYTNQGELYHDSSTGEYGIQFEKIANRLMRLRQLIIYLIDYISNHENFFYKMRSNHQFESNSSWADFIFLVVIRIDFESDDWKAVIPGVLRFYQKYWQYKDVHRWFLQKITVSEYRLTKPIKSKLYWFDKLPDDQSKLNIFNEDRAKSFDYPQSFQLVTHQFEMSHRAVVWRYDPCDHEFFEDLNNLHLELDKQIYLHSLRLIDVLTRRIIWELKGEKLIRQCYFNNLQCVNESKQIFQIIGLDPQVTYIDESASYSDANKPVVFEVTMQWLD